MSKAIYPGTFDPFYLGSFKYTGKACNIFDEGIIIAAVAEYTH